MWRGGALCPTGSHLKPEDFAFILAILLALWMSNIEPSDIFACNGRTLQFLSIDRRMVLYDMRVCSRHTKVFCMHVKNIKESGAAGKIFTARACTSRHKSDVVKSR